MPYEITSVEWVEINGVPLHTPAWHVANLDVLWRGPSTRGSDDIIPGADGVRPNRRRPTVTPVSLELCIVGTHDWEGNPNPDARIGLEENIDHLRANVTDPTGVGDGTVTCVLHLPSGATREGDVHIEGFDITGDGPGAVGAVIDLTIKQGALQ